MNKKIDSLVLLRAIAVVLVVFCHLGHPLEDDGLFGLFFELMHNYGKYGVHIFFVVSGFIIPYSMYKSHYTLNNYFKFLYKRLIRLHPPYLFALLLTLIISFFSYKLRHLNFPETLKSVFFSFFYFHVPADNPVFWTLAVEAQYYLLIGIIFTIDLFFC
ncbi:acyltransferase family protein [Runella zeae]|uniref:acyltransferase family protein n=1 Tax=Runella zeae TaxID=94255 RepID=UPI000491ACF8|nr:acyltransferase family protein [Runella zeae]